MIPAAYRSSHRGYDGIPGILEETLQSTLPGSVIVTKVAPSLSRPSRPSLTSLAETARIQVDALRATLEAITFRLDGVAQGSADLLGASQAFATCNDLCARIDAILPMLG